MFDKKDARLLLKGAVIVGTGSTLLLTISAVLGLSWRIFTVLAG